MFSLLLSVDENHDNFLNSLDSSGEPLRASRRKTSKAANEKIYRFVKQLRRPNSSDDEFYGTSLILLIGHA